MRIVKSEGVTTSRWRRHGHPASTTARVERLGLAVTSIVLLLGLWLTYVGQTEGFTTVAVDLASRRLVNLNAVRSADDLTPALQALNERSERDAIAAAIYTRLASERSPSQSAGQQDDEPRLEHVAGLLGPPPRTAGVLTPSNIAALKPFLIVRTPREFRRSIVIAVALFMVSFWLAHLVRWRFGTIGDGVLLPVVHLLTGLSLMAMIALRDPLRDTIAAMPVAQGLVAGCVLWTALGFIDFEDPRLRRAVLPPLVAAVLLAIALLIFGSGPSGSGAKVNLLGVQPVELIRLLVVFSLAAYFARRWQFLREFSERGPAPRWMGRLIRLPRWKDVRPLVVSISALLALFFLQRDLGPALVLSCVFLGLYGISRGRAALVVGGFVALAAGFGAGYVLGFPATVTRRVALALDPWENALPGGDQIAHALWAMASGGRWGVGPGVGDPQLIPAGHTDLVVAAIGEELGFVGLAAIVGLFAILVWRLLRISLRAPGDYTSLLTTGLTLAVVVQGLVLVAGILGLLPLAGVVTPFLSYGRSSMLSNIAAIAVCAAIACRPGPRRQAFAAPVRVLGWTLACAGGILLARGAYVQVVRGDEVATRANLTQQADGGYRYQYNPRLLAAARQIPRGTIYDRNGLPIATSRPAELKPFADRYRKLGITLPQECAAQPAEPSIRCYPLGGLAFHVLGEAQQQTNWAASNSSYIERDFDARLKGFDDHPTTVRIRNARNGHVYPAVKRDYRELLPLVRHKANRWHPRLRRLLARERDLHTTLDAGLQIQTARAVRVHTQRAGSDRGAATVLDPATGALLASVSYPWPLDHELTGDTPISEDRLLDRARYGLYPPGSTFKLVTAVAALRAAEASRSATFQCVRLPDGRVGGRVRGASRPIRDDPLDRVPHGRVDLRRGLVVSCNAYFSDLAQHVGARALFDAASAAQITTATPPGADSLEQTLPYAGYGQGHVLASPLRMARVAAALAAGGVLRDVRVTTSALERVAPDQRWVSPEAAALLRVYMREAVTSGTGRALGGHALAVAGKTGTAEVQAARSHSWFVGFAPYLSRHPLAFAVIVENAGYGGRVAAPIAGDNVNAAQTLGLFQ
jgi:cell division protein FtsW (lipid II flippase)